jgi:hypothetical protein
LKKPVLTTWMKKLSSRDDSLAMAKTATMRAELHRGGLAEDPRSGSCIPLSPVRDPANDCRRLLMARG